MMQRTPQSIPISASLFAKALLGQEAAEQIMLQATSHLRQTCGSTDEAGFLHRTSK
jgi:hypothetical protein